MDIKISYGEIEMIPSKYGDISLEALKSNCSDIINQIYKLLPLKESDSPDLPYHFSTLLFRIRGISSLFPYESRWITIMSLIESARTETDFKLYRKAILDSCSIVRVIGDTNA